MKRTSLIATVVVAAASITTIGLIARAADVSDADRKFVAAAASGGIAEVKLGEYASTHASRGEIKKFGDDMVADHTKANNDLKSLCSSEGVDCPADMNDQDKAKVDELTKLNGPAFDNAYVPAMVQDHDTTIALFKKEADDGSDPALKKFASDTLPTLEHHLEMAKALESIGRNK